jgi:hypothetical protein
MNQFLAPMTIIMTETLTTGTLLASVINRSKTGDHPMRTGIMVHQTTSPAESQIIVRSLVSKAAALNVISHSKIFCPILRQRKQTVLWIILTKYVNIILKAHFSL